MSKSLDNYVGINEPAPEIFGKLMSISDDLMWRYLELLSFQPMAQVRAKKKAVADGANPRDVKFEFAREIVERFHGKAAAQEAADGFNARFRDGQLPESMPEISLIGALAITQVLKQADLVPSVSEANRVIEQGGVKVDGEKVSDRALKLAKGTFVIQVGKRKVARVTLK
jgi:tyrosyl-tRNA synthetase